MTFLPVSGATEHLFLHENKLFIGPDVLGGEFHPN